jgi:hypothetical protein
MESLSDSLKAFELVLNFEKIEELMLQKLSPKRKKTHQKLPSKSKKTDQKLSAKLEKGHYKRPPEIGKNSSETVFEKRERSTEFFSPKPEKI